MHQEGFCIFLHFAVPFFSLHSSSFTACMSQGLSVCLPGCLLGCLPIPQHALSAFSPVANVLFAVSLRFLDFGLFYYLLSLVVTALSVQLLPLNTSIHLLSFSLT